MSKDTLGDRMKKYEKTTQSSLLGRSATIIRLDGKAFHTYTRKINKENDPSMINDPFSEKLHTAMCLTMEALGSQIQNAKFGYTQSDEISILLCDWDKLTTDPWYGGNIQKTVSVSAAIATANFNFHIGQLFPDIPYTPANFALFDSRVFNVPMSEVANYFVWRQQDATRNSINMLGQHHFSHNQLHKKNTSQVQDMLMLEKCVNWNNLHTWKKRGSCYTTRLGGDRQTKGIERNIPIFTQDRDYIEQYLT
jgi:tRNA(His) 5'-end guanylyltransferase